LVGGFVVRQPSPIRIKLSNRTFWHRGLDSGAETFHAHVLAVRPGTRGEVGEALMFKAEVKSWEASAPFNGYDSRLDVPDGTNLNQNAWLTLKLRIKFNFVDPKNTVTGLTVQRDGKWYAKDADGWLFPMLHWGEAYKNKFKTQFQQHAEKVWNWQFVLITPRTYQDLDVTNFSSGGGWLVRPNVLCLFRIELSDTNPHKTINVVNLDWAPGQVVNIDTTKNPNPKTITKFNSGTSRSDDSDYDDADLFRPYMFNKKENVWHDTIGHEVGHALGQDHIMILKGDNTCKTAEDGSNAKACYGTANVDKFNIMGGGDRIYLLNAISWRQRIALHTNGTTTPDNWGVTGVMSTLPRKMALGASLVGVPIF
jgi:hypothetical protein